VLATYLFLLFLSGILHYSYAKACGRFLEQPQHTSLTLRTSKAFKSWSIIALWLLSKRVHTGLGGGKVYIADGKDFKNFKLYQVVRKKDDYTDAYYLRLFFFERPKRVWRFSKELAHLRALIRQNMRNEKDITKHANRLSQYLAGGCQLFRSMMV
jgi:hypothetical protein